MVREWMAATALATWFTVGACAPTLDDNGELIPGSEAAGVVLSPVGEALDRGAFVDPLLQEAVAPQADDTVRVLVRLRTEPLEPDEEDDDGWVANPVAASERARFMRRLPPDAQVTGELRHALNAVFVTVPRARLDAVVEALRVDPLVKRMSRVTDGELDLGQVSSKIGASNLRTRLPGLDGSGVRVAVLDTGIDYTHANLGGSGLVADFQTNDPNTLRSPNPEFPTAKVVGGWDFVGSSWVRGQVEQPDPDPLDDNPVGHGTHVADIIGGLGQAATSTTPAIPTGVAPGVLLYAVKICSSIQLTCSGQAELQGIDFALDPDRDPANPGAPPNPVDVINLSIGAGYGAAFADDRAAALENAARLGVLTVTSAGNQQNRPFITSTPGVAAVALSVAQSAMPDREFQFVTTGTPNQVVTAARYPFSAPLAATFTAAVQYGDGAGGALTGCNNPNGVSPFASGSLLDRVVVVDAGGACPVLEKFQNIAAGGARAAIVARSSAGPPFTFSLLETLPIPAYAVSEADGLVLKGVASATFDVSQVQSLQDTIFITSSRGPRYDDGLLKPEIAAPGDSVSAKAGTGVGVDAFGGTSSSAPVVAGAAALLKQHLDPTDTRSEITPEVLKSILLTTADPNVFDETRTALAPVSRVGGGDVRVDRAVATPVVARVSPVSASEPSSGTLSFGFVDVSASSPAPLRRTVVLDNLSTAPVTYSVGAQFRYTDDAANGAVALTTLDPSSLTPLNAVTVPANGSAEVVVQLAVNGNLLRSNVLESGARGGDPTGLTQNEYDGYVVFSDEQAAGGAPTLSIPWHILPRRAAQVGPESTLAFGAGSTAQVEFSNTGVGTAQIEAFTWVASSPPLDPAAPGVRPLDPDLRAVGFNLAPVPNTTCATGQVLSFAFHLHQRLPHLVGAAHVVRLDLDSNGTDDYLVQNSDLGKALGGNPNGRHLTFARNLATGQTSGEFYSFHPTFSTNTVLRVCAEQVGLTVADLLTKSIGASFTVLRRDGTPADTVTGVRMTAARPQFRIVQFVDPSTGATGSFNLTTGDQRRMTVAQQPVFGADTPQRGMLLVTDAYRGATSTGGATESTEALLFERP